MSSLKDKFQNFREEPSVDTWQTLLKRLNAEMPQRKTRGVFWFLPIAIVLTGVALWQWMGTDTSSQSPAASKSEQPAPQNNAPDAVTSVESSVGVSGTTNPAGINPSAFASTASSTTAYTNGSAYYPMRFSTVITDSSSLSNTGTPTGAGTAHNADTSGRQPTTPAVAEDGRKGTEPDSAMDKKKDDPAAFAAIDTSGISSIPVPDSSVAANPDLRSKTTRGSFVLELYYGGGLSNMLTRTPQKEGMNPKRVADGLALRKGTEKAGFSFSTGVNLKYRITPAWQIQTGYHFTQLKQNVYYNSDTAKCNCGTSIALTQASGKISTDQYGNNNDTISIGNSHSYTNIYSMREIPVIVSYSFPSAVNQNIRYTAGLGFSYMYFSGVDSRMPDADNTGFVFTKNLNQFPFYRSTTSLLLNGALTYSTHHNIDYMIAPQFKVALTDISNVPYWLRQYPWQFTLGVGVGKRF